MYGITDRLLNAYYVNCPVNINFMKDPSDKISGINGLSGISEKEALRRLEDEGYNELPSAGRRSTLSITAEILKEPMFLLLIAGGAIYLMLGDVQEAAMLLGFVFIIISITLYQERKTERALEALRDMSSPRAFVIRDGKHKRIAGREVVRGDIIVVSEGDRIPADAALTSCANLLVDESLLTGEAAPVSKVCSDIGAHDVSPGGDGLPFVFAGTLVVQGSGVAEVRSTGINTEIGKIGKSLQAIAPEKTALQKETALIVRKLAFIGLSLCIIVVITYGLTKGNWLNGFLAGITLAMSILPEEFPVILTVFLALGAWRISHNRVLTRRTPVVETLGSAGVLCVDKTGTLTLNHMSVRKIFSGGIFYDTSDLSSPLPEELHEIVEFSMLASRTSPFDPMEKAFRDLGSQALTGTEHLHDDWTLIQEYPLTGNLLAMSRVWKSSGNNDYVIASKGAPEAVAEICHLTGEGLKDLEEHINAMAELGLRVIGIAKAEFRETALPYEQHDFRFEFIGLLGLADPVRPGVSRAIKECYHAGIRVVMITGDYPATARNIADQIGIRQANEIISGPELGLMNDSELQRRILSTNIFARIVPEQKLRIVNAFKSIGKVVAMTGDGVNDAPALKSAQIGIAMGGRGTDVAREASGMVLLDDDFASIVQAVRMGRRIFDNIKKAMSYTLAVHVPIAGIAVIPLFFNWPLVLLPVHIVFLELIIDPACSIVFEAEREEAHIMERPPRDLDDPLFNRRTVIFSLLQGIIVLLAVATVFVTATLRGLGETDARALTFTSLIIANLGLILVNRSWSRSIAGTLRQPNTALWLVLAGSVFFLAVVLYVPFLREMFRFSRLHLNDLFISAAAGGVSILLIEGVKMVQRQRTKPLP